MNKHAVWLFIGLCSLFSCLTPGEQAPEEQGIRIGVLLPLTGHLSGLGRSSQNSIGLYFDKLNAGGGIDGNRVQYFIEDTAGTPESSADKARYLIDTLKVQAILGPISSQEALAAGEICQERGVPMICTAATLKEVTGVGDCIFRAALIEDYQIYITAKFAIESLNSRKAALITHPDEPFTRWFADIFEEEYRKLGGAEVLRIDLRENDPRLEATIRSIRSFAPDVLYLPAAPGRVADLVRALRQQRIDAILLGSSLWLSVRENIELLEGSYFIDHYSPETYEANSREFVRRYSQEFAAAPDPIAALAYEAAIIMAEAFLRAGRPDPRDVKNALKQTDIETIIGRFRFDELRNPQKPAIINQIKNGQVRYVVSVYPQVLEQKQVLERIRAAAPADKSRLPLVAILDFSRSKVSEEDSLVIVDLLASALNNTGTFRVLERAKRDQVLSELEYSQSDLVHEEYQITVGRQLAANRIITGSLGHLAERFILNIKLIEVESGVTLSASYQVYRSLTDLVDNADDLVADLVSKL